jgi:hypothetical protein
MRFQKQTEFLVSMAGIVKRSTLVAFSPAKIGVLSLPYIQPACGFQYRRMAQRSFEKVMVQVKAAAPRRVKLMTRRLRRRKQTLPNAHSFGLALYRSAKPTSPTPDSVVQPVAASSELRLGFHPDDTTPIPHPSRYYGRRQYPSLTEQLRKESAALAPSLVPEEAHPTPARIDKSQLTIAQPKRLRDKAHLKFVASQPCLVCERQPSDPHHLRFAQPKAISLKVSDEFTVPLCRGHHRQLHQAGNEATWWKNLNIDPLPIAKTLWDQTHPGSAGNPSNQPLRTTL